MGKPDAPQPTPPEQTAAASTGTNVSTAIANAILQNPSQITPDGSLTYSFQGGGSVPSVEEFTVPGTPGTVSGPVRDDVYYERTGEARPTATGGTPDSTQYRVGDQTFTDRAAADAYRNDLMSQQGGYTWTDEFTGQTYNIPKITATQTLSPEAQAIKDKTTEAQGNLAQLAVNQSASLTDMLSNPLDTSGLQDRQQYADIPQPELQTYGNNSSLAALLDGRGEITNGFERGGIQGSVSGSQDYTTGVSVPGLTSSVHSTGAQNGMIDDAGQIQTSAGINRITNPGQVSATVNNGQYATTFGDAGGVQGSAGSQGIRDAGSFNPVSFNYNSNGGVNAGDITRNIADVAPASRDIGATSGGIQYGFGDVGDVQTSFGGTRGNIQYSYGGDFADQRDEVQNALMERMQPGQDRDLARLEARLASQGLRLGSEAYQAAMDDYGRSVNDARLGAILAGGQEQSRLVNMERDRAVFNNNAQQQDYLQKYQRALFNNQGVAQRYNQEMGRAGLNNVAQAQDFGQQQARAGFAADQQRTEFDQAAARAGFSNAAQAQAYGQGADGANRALQAAQSDLQAQTTNANLGLQSAQQGINRDISAANLDLARGQFTNDAQRQAFDQALARGDFANEAEAMRFANELAAANLSSSNQQFNVGTDLQTQLANRTAGLEEAAFANDAQAQQFGQNLQQTNTANDAATQQLMNELASSGFGNDALSQMFAMDQQNANLNNDVLSTLFNQNLAAGEFANDAQGQDFAQQMGLAELSNSAQGQEVQQLLAQAGLLQGDIENDRISTDQLNQLLGTTYDRALSADARSVDQANQQRDQALNEMLALRNQPINEITALLSGSQVSQPNFVNPNVSGIPTTDVAGIISNYDQQQMQNYQTQLASRNALLGNIFSLF